MSEIDGASAGPGPEPESAMEPAPQAEPVSESEPVTETEPHAEPAAESEPVPAEPEASAAPLGSGEPTESEPAPPEPTAAQPTPAASAGSEAAPAESIAAESVQAEAEPVVSASAPEARKRQTTLPPPPPGRTTGEEAAPATAPDAGKILGGIATAITEDEVELVLEDGRLAVIHRRNFAPSDTQDLTKVVTQGDRLEGAVLVREDPRDRVVLSRAWAIEKRAWEQVAQAAEDHSTIECEVTGVSKNGLVVDVMGVRGFVPLSHVDLETPKDLGAFKGQRVELKIIELDPNPQKRRLVLSRRSVLLREQRKEVHSVLSSLVIGETRRGRVDSLSDYGAFVDLGGVNGLVHVSELAWTRVRHPSEVVSVGDEIEVKVLEVKVKKRRVRLSLREVSDDPLAGVETGAISTGRITRLVDFGAFVDLGGVEGLVHLSELAEYRVSAPEELFTPGDEVMVKVLSVDPKRRRIELSIRQAISDQFG